MSKTLCIPAIVVLMCVYSASAGRYFPRDASLVLFNPCVGRNIESEDPSTCMYGSYEYCHITRCYRGVQDACDHDYHRCHPQAVCVPNQVVSTYNSPDQSIQEKRSGIMPTLICNGHSNTDMKRFEYNNGFMI